MRKDAPHKAWARARRAPARSAATRRLELPLHVELVAFGLDGHRAWLSRNCHRCGTYRPAQNFAPSAANCLMSEALIDDAVVGGVPLLLARRFGATIEAEAATLPHDCPRFARRRGRAA